jgi:hypothetical protein
MRLGCTSTWVAVMMFLSVVWFLSIATEAQLTDITQTPNAENAGIQKSLGQQIGTDRGDVMTPDSSLFIIRRDPFRSIRRGRQVFQRKFTVAQAFGPRLNDCGGVRWGNGAAGAGSRCAIGVGRCACCDAGRHGPRRLVGPDRTPHVSWPSRRVAVGTRSPRAWSIIWSSTSSTTLSPGPSAKLGRHGLAVAQSERLLSSVVDGGAAVKKRGYSDPGRVREDLANEEALAP